MSSAVMSSSHVVPTGWLVGPVVGSAEGDVVGSLVELELGLGVELADADGAGSGEHPARSTVPTDAATISARERDERGKESKEAMDVSLWGIEERYQARHAPKLMLLRARRSGSAGEYLPIESNP
ncbi:hypothetical protein D9V28_13815 [Mycetocola zhadangensis]|uniref:Uncharacterized protein n=1 Tax=Mycetocola zhadangensis TaxID=1164595 RepID=A0A3L7IT47_9MICO|nr:hypothetical protein D9V28_13815 [Mycetocola zhadangensis]GGF01773.1 hypothetical protein GCM10011313_26110 [Mycetocola zhadangensis]